MTLNGGSSWQDISGAIPVRWITRVSFDPHDDATIYATLSGFRWDEPLPHVFMSSDLGENWQSISSNLPELPVNCIILDPEREGNIYLGTDSGVFFSSNAGANWESWAHNMPKVPVTDLKIHNPTRMLFCGTYGISVFALNLDQTLLGDINQDGIINVLDIVLIVNLIFINQYDESADLNMDGILNVLDIVLLSNIILDN